MLLYEGRFHKDVKVMAAHNSLEAAPFISTSISTVDDLVAVLKTSYPAASNATVNTVLTLYPASAYSNSSFLRAVQIASDSQFSCSTRFLSLALDNQTYNYLFAYPPGYHGKKTRRVPSLALECRAVTDSQPSEAEDTSYTFFNGDTSTLDDGYAVNAALAYALQDYIVGFTISGAPDGSPAGTALEFAMYGSNATVVEFAASGLLTTTDDMANDRCSWWQEAYVQGLV